MNIVVMFLIYAYHEYCTLNSYITINYDNYHDTYVTHHLCEWYVVAPRMTQTDTIIIIR